MGQGPDGEMQSGQEIGGRGLGARLSGFRRDESGSILIFGIIMLTTVILLCGIALDVIHFEAERTTAQATLDRAVLAAADLSNTTPAQDVVDDYFQKAGVSRFSPKVTQTSGSMNEWKKVVGTVDVSTSTWFMRNFGIETLDGPSLATAQEAIGKVEISMVLDVSGSMANDAMKVWDSASGQYVYKLTLLKPAAVDFVKTMFTNVSNAGGSDGTLMISVVPYAEQVNIGTSLANQMTLTSEHTKGTCVDFTASDFNTIQITGTQTLARTAYADVRTRDYHPSGYAAPYFRECWGYDTTQTASVLAFSQNKQTIIDKINALVAEGDTAIDIGAKWGLALLDPAIRPTLNKMVTAGTVSSTLKDHPIAYTDTNTLKIMVLMTDGSNTNTFRLKNYRSGTSNIVYKTTSNWQGTTTTYYWYDSSRSSNKYYNFSTKSWTSVSGTTSMTWQQVWETWSVAYFADNFAAKLPNTTADGFFSSIVDHVGNVEKDARLKKVCDAAKAAGTKIFAIAYGADANGEAALKDCVSAASNYYAPQGSEIGAAFAGIANSIRLLRLTQ
ncbi:TadE/TadG family type IV pilus assembly protein [Frigidibacter sp. MR17.24]|uniref:TadE/TadG family type IV pilus assembly protein n=1 Tax=Frigidibacter sp. MR17.24 TaxID=3127345 RepID=UPI003012F765